MISFLFDYKLFYLVLYFVTTVLFQATFYFKRYSLKDSFIFALYLFIYLFTYIFIYFFPIGVLRLKISIFQSGPCNITVGQRTEPGGDLTIIRRFLVLLLKTYSVEIKSREVTTEYYLANDHTTCDLF